jgi:hypothetical protein
MNEGTNERNKERVGGIAANANNSDYLRRQTAACRLKTTANI